MAHGSSVRTFFAWVAIQDLECESSDFNTAFLKARIPSGQRFYVQQPTGLGNAKEGYACRLNNALYGLKEAPLWWVLYIMGEMKKYGFRSVDGEPCLLIHDDSTIILIYVDDCCIAAPTTNQVSKAKDMLKKACGMKDLGPIDQYLGYEIQRDRVNRRIYVDQPKYAQTMLERYEYLGLNPTKTPLPSIFCWNVRYAGTLKGVSRSGDLGATPLGGERLKTGIKRIPPFPLRGAGHSNSQSESHSCSTGTVTYITTEIYLYYKVPRLTKRTKPSDLPKSGLTHSSPHTPSTKGLDFDLILQQQEEEFYDIPCCLFSFDYCTLISGAVVLF